MKLQMKQREESRDTPYLRSSANPNATTACFWDRLPKKAARVRADHRSAGPAPEAPNSSNTRHQALWRHALTSSPSSPAPASPLQFSVKECTEGYVPADGIPGTPASLLKQQRKRKYQKSGRPRDWRTRKDPFEGEWEQVTSWLLANPALTGVDIFHKLEELSPGRYRPTQVRTLQRGLGKLRARLLVTFDDGWGEEVLGGHAAVPELHAEVVGGVG